MLHLLAKYITMHPVINYPIIVTTYFLVVTIRSVCELCIRYGLRVKIAFIGLCVIAHENEIQKKYKLNTYAFQ